MTRETLPQRRMAISFDFNAARLDGGIVPYRASVGFYPDGRPGEVFMSSTKAGSDIDVAARDCAILLSFALQAGCDLATISAALTRDELGKPQGPAAALTDAIKEVLGEHEQAERAQP